MEVAEFFACGHLRMRQDLLLTAYLPSTPENPHDNSDHSIAPAQAHKLETTEMPLDGRFFTVLDGLYSLRKKFPIFTSTACPQSECQNISSRDSAYRPHQHSQMSLMEELRINNMIDSLRQAQSQMELQFAEINLVADSHPSGLATRCPWDPDASFSQVIQRLDTEIGVARNMLTRFEWLLKYNRPSFTFDTLFFVAFDHLGQLTARLHNFEINLESLTSATPNGTEVPAPGTRYTDDDHDNGYLSTPPFSEAATGHLIRTPPSEKFVDAVETGVNPSSGQAQP